MNLISLVITLVIVAFVLYLINVLVPGDARIKNVISAIVCLFVLLWILQQVGFLGGMNLRLR